MGTDRMPAEGSQTTLTVPCTENKEMADGIITSRVWMKSLVEEYNSILYEGKRIDGGAFE
jgi:hypothetical protein